jgi:peptidoglycan/LPS O-acetylase OafA/YrhL
MLSITISILGGEVTWHLIEKQFLKLKKSTKLNNPPIDQTKPTL